MLHELISTHRDELIERCRVLVSARLSPKATEPEMGNGVPLFLDQLIETLRLDMKSNPNIGASAAKHGKDLLIHGFSVSQVVHDYGDVCQSVTRLAEDLNVPITVPEFRTLNRCLDDAIAVAVTEYGRGRQLEDDNHGEQRLNERLGVFAHDLRNQLTRAMLAFDMLQSGRVGPGGSTAGALGRSLTGLRDLIDRSLSEVRLSAGLQHRERVLVAELLEDAEVYAGMEANARHLKLIVGPADPLLAINADRQLMASVLSNLLDNAFKFSKPDRSVSLQVRATEARVFIDVADGCGGLPPGKAEDLFRPFEQRSIDRSGVGLGLAICRRGVQAHGGTLDVQDLPGVGCVFTVDLPRLK